MQKNKVKYVLIGGITCLVVAGGIGVSLLLSQANSKEENTVKQQTSDGSSVVINSSDNTEESQIRPGKDKAPDTEENIIEIQSAQSTIAITVPKQYPSNVTSIILSDPLLGQTAKININGAELSLSTEITSNNIKKVSESKLLDICTITDLRSVDTTTAYGDLYRGYIAQRNQYHYFTNVSADPANKVFANQNNYPLVQEGLNKSYLAIILQFPADFTEEEKQVTQQIAEDIIQNIYVY